jgi:hypothetical protein
MIPKVIHFIWISLGEEFCMKYQWGIRSAVANTTMKVVLHTDDSTIQIPGVETRVRQFPTEINNILFNNKDELKDIKTDSFLTSRKRVSHIKDIVRLDILFEEGGVYSDLDTLWFRNPWEFFSKKVVIGFCNKAYKTLCNAVMMSEPAHPALKKYKDWIVSIYPCKKYWIPANPYKIWKDNPDITFVDKYLFFAVTFRKFSTAKIEDVKSSICLHIGMSVVGQEETAEQFYNLICPQE